MPTATYKMDGKRGPGKADVKVLKRLETPHAKKVKGLTGYHLYLVEIIRVVNPTTFGPTPQPGTRLVVSARDLAFKRSKPKARMQARRMRR